MIITDRAAAQIITHSKRASVPGFRISLKSSGCAGYKYIVVVSEKQDNDIEINNGEATIFVNPKDMPFLDGMVLDYIKDGLNARFTFENSNVSSECGCGESVNFKNQS